MAYPVVLPLTWAQVRAGLTPKFKDAAVLAEHVVVRPAAAETHIYRPVLETDFTAGTLQV